MKSIILIFLLVCVIGHAQDPEDQLFQLPVATGPYVSGSEVEVAPNWYNWYVVR